VDLQAATNKFFSFKYSNDLCKRKPFSTREGEGLGSVGGAREEGGGGGRADGGAGGATCRRRFHHSDGGRVRGSVVACRRSGGLVRVVARWWVAVWRGHHLDHGWQGRLAKRRTLGVSGRERRWWGHALPLSVAQDPCVKHDGPLLTNA
jgi:hypothetical protein